MMDASSPFLPLLLITGLAVLVPILASRLRRVQLPIVVGEILAGVVIGRSGLDLVHPSPILQFLAEFGFTFLMFLSGLEINFDLLRFPGRERDGGRGALTPLPLGVAFLGLTLLLAYLGSLGLFQARLIQNPLLMALILSTTSLGVVLPVLKERQLQETTYGQYLLVAASIADFATLVLLAIAVAALSGGLTLDLLLLLVLLVAFALVSRVGLLFRSFPRLYEWIEDLSHATAQIRVRGALAFMVAWVVLADALGAEIILGAFLAGAIVSLLGGEDESQLREKLDAIGFGFFIPLFFIIVGVEFNLTALLASPRALVLMPGLLALAYLVKLLPALLLRRLFSWREALAGGLLLSSRLSLIIAASAVALDLGAIDEAIHSDIILLAILTCTFSTLAFNRVLPHVAEQRREGTIIVGSSPLADLLADRLQAVDEPYVVLGQRRAGRPEAQDDASALRHAGAEQAAALVVLEEDIARVLRVSTLARNTFRIPLVVARVQDVEAVPALKAMGVKVVQPTLATAIAIEGALRFPTAFDVLVHQDDDVEVGEVVLGNGSLAALPIRDVRLPGNALILSIQRDSNVLVPDGDTILRLGDHVGLIGSPESVKRSVSLLSG